MSLYQNFDLTNEFNILRLACGLFLLPHLYAKASNLELTYKIYDDFRLYPIKLWVFSCIAIEIVCAIGMVFAIYTRYVALRGGGISLGRGLGGVALQQGKMAVANRRFRVLPVLGDLLHRGRHARLKRKRRCF